METSVVLHENAKKIFQFTEVFTDRAAQEQAEKKKLDAFGMLTKIAVWNRPKPESVVLVKWERRHEPFWHVSARREIDYIHEAVYPVQVNNPHALKIKIEERDFDVTRSGGKSHIEIPVKEECHRKIDVTLHQNGLQRDIKSSTLQKYIGTYKVKEVDELTEIEDAVVPARPLAAVLSTIKSKLSTESINAHAVLQDVIYFEKAHLYYRPVFAFEFSWVAGEKVGVIEVDGLTGEVIENGEWMKDKITSVVTRENLFDVGADVVSLMGFAPASLAIKLIEKATRPK